MSIDPGETTEDVVVLPPVPLDPVFAEAVDDAMAGPQVPTSPHDPDRVLGADPHDFAGLYIRHRSSFGLHARRFLRDQRDVDEVVQEAFLRLFLALPELQSELQALAYCRRTITNLCIDRYRADQRRPRLIDLESVPVDVLGEDEPDDPVIQAEDAAFVREALALLSPLHREALVKREIEEKPLPQIAAELGVPEDSVKHLLHRARRALRKRLADAHRAKGLDVDDMSTLSLLARSAVAGSGRAGVLVLLLAGLVAGVSTSRVPSQAFETISGLWAPEAPAAPAPPRVVTPGGPEAPLPLVGPDAVLGLDDPGPIVAGPAPVGPGPVAPPAVAAVPPAAAASATVDTSPTPRPVPSVTPASPAPEPTGLPTVLPEVEPRPTSTASREPEGGRPTPHVQARPTPTRTASADEDVEPSAAPSKAATASPEPSGAAPDEDEGGPVRTLSQLRAER